jgi:hypothetical protein
MELMIAFHPDTDERRGPGRDDAYEEKSPFMINTH